MGAMMEGRKEGADWWRHRGGAGRAASWCPRRRPQVCSRGARAADEDGGGGDGNRCGAGGGAVRCGRGVRPGPALPCVPLTAPAPPDPPPPHRRVYLDHNATTPLAPEAAQAVRDAMSQAWGNPSSSHPAGMDRGRCCGSGAGLSPAPLEPMAELLGPIPQAGRRRS